MWKDCVKRDTEAAESNDNRQEIAEMVECLVSGMILNGQDQRGRRKKN